MVRPMPNHSDRTYTFSSILWMFVSVALCAKHAGKYSSETNTPHVKPPFPSAAKQLIATAGRKAMARLVHAKKSGLELNSKIFGKNKKLMLGHKESGLWQKAIMMGEKCKPPEFPGVIYYDYDGNRVPEMPKSPRLGPMSPLTKLTWPVEKIDKLCIDNE